MHNQGDTATVTCSNALSTLPVENIQKVPRSKLMRTSNAASTTINGDFSGAKTISAMVLGRHNLTSGCTVTFTIYSGTGQSGQLATSGAITITDDMALEAASEIEFQDPKSVAWYSLDGNGDKQAYTNVQSFRIVIAPGSGSNTYFDVGRVIVGDFVEPSYNMSYNHSLSYGETTKQFRTASGTLRSDVSLPYKMFTFNLGVVSEADRQIMQEAFADVGLRKDFFLDAFPECTDDRKRMDYSAIMKLKRTPAFTGIQSGWLKAKYTMEEV